MRLSNVGDRTDHLGNIYTSIKEMCERYDISPSVYIRRLKRGWNKEEALTNPLDIRSTNNENSVENRTDHLGNIYKSATDMCNEYGIKWSIYNKRIELGWSKEKALTTIKRKCDDEVKDHLGNVYDSLREMCKAYNIDYYTYCNRVNKLKWDKEKALTSNSTAVEDRTDHLGNIFPTIGSMCLHWGVHTTTYRNRLKIGMTKKEALTTPLYKSKTEKIDTDGILTKFKSISEMCRAFVIDASTFYRRNGTIQEKLGIDENGIRHRIGTTWNGVNILDIEESTVKVALVENSEEMFTLSVEMLIKLCLSRYKHK